MSAIYRQMKTIFLNTTIRIGFGGNGGGGGGGYGSSGRCSIITMCIIFIMFILCNLYVSHASIAQQASRCKWKILNNSNKVTTATTAAAAAATATMNNIANSDSKLDLVIDDDTLFKFTCNIHQFNDTLEQYIQTNSNGFKERDFNKIHQIILYCVPEDSTVINNIDVDTVENEIEINFLNKKFNHLNQLTIEYCRLKRLPDNIFLQLNDLQELKISNNISHGLSNLELFSNTFNKLNKLHTLDLSWNSIWSVPSNIFCTMPKLQRLVISHNSLNELTQLDFSQSSSGNGIGWNCTYSSIEVLDASFNKIVYIASFDLYLLKNLKVLLLEHNHIQEVYENGFAGLYELTYINLAHNKIVALPQTIFKSSRNLVKLILKNNSLSMLTPSIFDTLNKLEVLDLSHNFFVSTWINGFIFARLGNLVSLSIANNSLQRLDEFLFNDLKRLEVLELQNNEINWIHDRTFVQLKQLKVLNLSFNKLRSLDRPFFTAENTLVQLSLESNVLINIDPQFFKDLSSLQDLNLSGNLFTEIPVGLGFMHSLKSLDLGKNNIHFIDGTRFEGLSNLLGLRMVDNFITNLTQTSFYSLPSLQILNLASNRLKYIHKNAFTHNTMVHAIRLNNNQLENTFGLFKSLKLLIWLDIGFNNIHELNFYDIPINIKELNLQNNKISHIPSQAFFQRRQLTKVNLKYNHIKHINRDAIQIYERGADENNIKFGNGATAMQLTNSMQTEIFLEGNPLVCDCHTEWFKESGTHHEYPTIMDIFNLTCMIDQFRQNIKQINYIAKMMHNRFLCRYDTHCFNGCQCCEFDACDCKYTCPRACDCFHDEFWHINVVDCGRAEYFDIPKTIPMDATEIYLDGNDMGQLGEHILLGKKNLEILYLNTSQITAIHNRTFVGIPKLQKLHLENNFIEKINELMFETLELLVELYLDSNLLEIIPSGMFARHKHLKVIHLSNNRLKSLEFINSLPKNVVLASSFFIENTWDCLCIMTDNQRVIRLFKKLCPKSKCGYSLQPNVSPLGEQLIKQEYVQLWAGILVSIIGTTFLLALACNFRTNFYLYLYKTYNIKLQKDPTERLDIHKTYDATIIFNHRDSDFIYRIFTVRLNGIKLHYQNNILENPINNKSSVAVAVTTANNTLSEIQSHHHQQQQHSEFSHDNFVSYIEMSKRLILIFSGNFLNTEWRNQQFKIALKNYLDRLKTHIRPFRILMILSVPLDIILLDPILEEMIKSCSVLFWGEQQFWEKLFYAMPNPNSKYNNNINLNQKLCGHNNKHKQDIITEHQQQQHPQHTRLLLLGDGNSSINSGTDCENNKNNIPNNDDNLSFSGLSQTQSYKFYNAQTYVNKSTGHIYTTIEESNGGSSGRSQPNTTTNTTITSNDITDNGKAYFV